jgi:hypothetical protein
MYNNEADDGPVGLKHVILWNKTWSDRCEEVTVIRKYTWFNIFNTSRYHNIEIDSMFLRNVGIYVQVFMELQPKITTASWTFFTLVAMRT